MIGLEYILKINDDTNVTELAEKLNIKKQNISRWFKGDRKIPEKYLPVLAELFQVPEEYFSKELNNLDKMSIQRIKLENEIGGIIDSKEKIQKNLELEDLCIDMNLYESIQKFLDVINLESRSFNEAGSVAISVDLFADLLNVRNIGEIAILKRVSILNVINDSLLTILSFYNKNYSIEREFDEFDQYKSRHDIERDKAEDEFKKSLLKLLKKRDSEEDKYLKQREEMMNEINLK